MEDGNPTEYELRIMELARQLFRNLHGIMTRPAMYGEMETREFLARSELRSLVFLVHGIHMPRIPDDKEYWQICFIHGISAQTSIASQIVSASSSEEFQTLGEKHSHILTKYIQLVYDKYGLNSLIFDEVATEFLVNKLRLSFVVGVMEA